MTAAPPPDTARERGRAPLLATPLLRRIRARCVTRARRYRRNHPGFSSHEEMYFFFGALAVLDCFPDAAAKELKEQRFRDLCEQRPPGDSPSDHEASARLAERTALFSAACAALRGDAAPAGKDGAK